MKLVLAFFIAAFAFPCFAAAASDEESTVYASGKGWTVRRYVDSCTLMVSYPPGTDLWVSYTVGTNRAGFSVIDTAFKAVKAGEKYSVALHFMKNGNLDSGWGDLDMKGIELSDGLKGLMTKLNAFDFLSDLKSSSALVLTRNNDAIIVEKLDLTDSAKYVAKLEACAQDVHRVNPADPFG